MQTTPNRAASARARTRFDSPDGLPAHPPTQELRLRRPPAGDGAVMWELARHEVDENSPYAYLMFAEYFADSCVVAERGGRPVAFVSGFRRPDEPSTQFVWQIVVGPEARGEGLGSAMLDAVVDAGAEPATHLEATVNPTNEASQRLFRSFARRRGAPCEEDLLFAAEDFPANAADHEAEIRFRIGPW